MPCMQVDMQTEHNQPPMSTGKNRRAFDGRCLARRVPLMICLSVLAVTTQAQDVPSLDDLLGLPKQAETVESDERGGASTESDPSDSAAITAGGGFGEVLAEMLRAQKVLAEGLGLPAQRQQQAVLARLDQLIAEAKQQQQSSQSQASSSKAQQQQQSEQSQQSQNQPGQQQQQQASQQQQEPKKGNQGDKTQAGVGSAEVGEAMNGEAAFEELRAGWGKLPPRVREALLQGKDQRVSSVYRRLTEAYFQRLAELSTEQNR